MNLNELWKDMRGDTLEWTRHALPRLLVVLLVAFILVRLLRAGLLLSRRCERFVRAYGFAARMRRVGSSDTERPWWRGSSG